MRLELLRPLILVVEDEALVRIMMEQALAERGVQCHSAGSVAEALGLLKTLKFSAAILDINLRNETVYPVAVELVLQGIHFIFASGYDPENVPAQFAHAPHFVKPYNTDVLVETIVAYVSNLGTKE